MTASATNPVQSSGKDQFLRAYNREHEITMRVLRAYPADKLDLRPHEFSKSARELAWIFVGERGLGARVFRDDFAKQAPAGRAPEAPNDWNEILAALEQAHRDFGELVQSTPDDELLGMVKFFTGPKTLGDYSRIEFAWFLLHDQIHHRGQFSVYLRMAGGKVPSIYGPTRDEPWF